MHQSDVIQCIFLFYKQYICIFPDITTTITGPHAGLKPCSMHRKPCPAVRVHCEQMLKFVGKAVEIMSCDSLMTDFLIWKVSQLERFPTLNINLNLMITQLNGSQISVVSKSEMCMVPIIVLIFWKGCHVLKAFLVSHCYRSDFVLPTKYVIVW